MLWRQMLIWDAMAGAEYPHVQVRGDELLLNVSTCTLDETMDVEPMDVDGQLC